MTMSNARTITLASLFLAASVVAQEPHSYNGTWHAEFENKKGGDMEGTVVIKDQGGTWDIGKKVRNKPCTGLASPITIQRATVDELVFEVNNSKVLMGCKDVLATLKRVDEKTLQGEFAEGRKITLIRQ
jgi:hypothetical protein